jgi:hypothetical protein
VRAPAATAAEVLDKLPTTKKPAEQAAQHPGGRVGHQFLVRIDIAAVMPRRGLRAAERLGVADQHRQRGGLALARSSKMA